MVVTGAVLACAGAAFWLYGLIDLLLTPGENCRYLPKLSWVAVVAVVFGFGAVAWLVFGRPARSRSVWRDALRFRKRPRPAPSPVRGRGWRGSLAAWRGGRYGQQALGQMVDARSRHPAGRARTFGPDDDPAFLRHLDDLIRGNQDIGND